jgi:hypothetical protein
MRYQIPAYAIIRIDECHGPDLQKKYGITVLKIVWSMEIAVEEVRRLNDVNEGTDCSYSWQYTRVDPNIVPDVQVEHDNSALFVG